MGATKGIGGKIWVKRFGAIEKEATGERHLAWRDEAGIVFCEIAGVQLWWKIDWIKSTICKSH